MTDTQAPVDLLVLGGGMAGLTAAASAASQGAQVILVEQGEQVGGSAIYAGFAWTAPSPDVMAEVNPHGDPDLADVLLGGFDRGVQWIRSLGVDCRPAVTVLRYGRGHQFDTTHYLSACEQRIKEHGGDVLTRARAESLLMDEGTVHGARCRLPDGSLRPIAAKWTMLATGGFQGDPVLRAQLIHPQARDLQLRANPHSDGDGLRLGLSAGAAVGKPGAGFYGHLVPAGVPLSDPSTFVDLALYYSEHALLFNLEGDRFVDETIGDHITTMALLAQPGARGSWWPTGRCTGSGSPAPTSRASRGSTSSPWPAAAVRGARWPRAWRTSICSPPTGATRGRRSVPRSRLSTAILVAAARAARTTGG